MARFTRPLSRPVVRSARFFLTTVAMAAVVTVIPGAAPRAQRQTDPVALRALSERFAANLAARRPPLYYDLLRSTDPAHEALNRNANLQLMFIRENGMPTYYLMNNLNAAKTVRTVDVWPASGFYTLTGSSTAAGELALWDGSGVLTSHVEFGGRVTQIDAPGATSEHSTHVAGTMVAAGGDPNARGMSYEALLHAYDWNADTVEMANAAAGGLMVSNHSYGIVAGWEGNYWYGDSTISAAEDYLFGFYDSNASEFDQIAYNAPNYLIVVGAGNDRNDNWLGTHFHWSGGMWVSANDLHGADGQNGGFDTISSFANAKNILTVGAVNDIPGGYTQPGDVVQTPFSSWGPCDDGRIKPDIVANGLGVYSTSDVSTISYATLTGTSMASPNASGSVNLIAHEYEDQFGKLPWSSTLKAIVINTADEAGPADGPDYSNGWGLLNTHRAIDLVNMHGNDAGGTYEWTINVGEVHEYYFTVDSPQDARLTLAWTDPVGPVQQPSLDPPNKMLVHDLDIRITHLDSGTQYLPWVLDPANPALPPAQADNASDNVEQIDIAGAAPGSYYAVITSKNFIQFTQDYSMVWRGMRASQPPEFAGASAYIDLGGPAFPATVHMEDGFQERGVFITAIRDVAVTEIGLNLAVPCPAPVDVLVFEATGTVRGPLLATGTATARHPGEIFHYIPVSTFLQACQDYEILFRFHNVVSWPAWDEPSGGAIPSVQEPFDVGAAIRVQDGALSGSPVTPFLPHFRLKGAVLPQNVVDLAPPGPWGPAPAFNGFVGMYVKPDRTFSVDGLAFAAGFPASTSVTLRARVYEASGLARGNLLAEGYSVFNNGGTTAVQLWGIPVEAVLEEGKEYDIDVEFPTVASFEYLDETGVTPYMSGPLEVLDAEMEGDPLSTFLPHFELSWTEYAGGSPFDLNKYTDVQPPPFTPPVPNIDNGVYVTSLVDQQVYSLGLMADIPAGEVITMRIYEAAGTTRGPLLAEGDVLSSGNGMMWHDVPVSANLVAGADYDFEASAANVTTWSYWDDSAGMPYQPYGVIQVRDAEQAGNAGAIELVHIRMNGCLSTLTSVSGPTAAPRFLLGAPYPNPATGTATIDFSLDRDEVVSIGVYDVKGRRVATLLEGAARSSGPGSVRFDAAGLASGIYFVKLQTAERSVSRKITIMR